MHLTIELTKDKLEIHTKKSLRLNKQPVRGLYTGYDDERQAYQIFIKANLEPVEKVLTIIHELEHFLEDQSIEFDDPTDYDAIAIFIRNLVLLEEDLK